MNSVSPSNDVDSDRRVTWYVANLVFLSTHQVDAAYWHEWSVFGVPGGLEFFLAFNVFAMAVLALGLVHVAQRRPSARAFVLTCAGVGCLTLGLHAFFLFHDRVAFWSVPSFLLFAAIAVSTAAQFVSARLTKSRVVGELSDV